MSDKPIDLNEWKAEIAARVYARDYPFFAFSDPMTKTQALAVPFENNQIGEMQQKGITISYVTKRAIIERLNLVLGANNVSFRYIDDPETKLTKGILSIRYHEDDDWTTHENTGDENTFSPEKSRVTDALKRCAVMFGVAAHLEPYKK